MPIFQEPYMNLKKEEPLNGGELKREIAARTHVTAAVVDLIIDTLKEVATEEIVNKGSFNFSGLFAVKNYQTKATVTPKGEIPARPRLSIRLNDRVKKLWNNKIRSGATGKRSFEELLASFKSGAPALTENVHTISNPMLEDDDEF